MATMTPAVPLLAFPRAEVEACLRNELVEAIETEASVKGIALPAAPEQIATTSFEIDSLVVVSILCAIESIIEIELPETVVRTGGYSSVEHAVECLLPRIEKQWLKKGVNR
jgi:hypothetical protein